MFLCHVQALDKANKALKAAETVRRVAYAAVQANATLKRFVNDGTEDVDATNASQHLKNQQDIAER